MHATFVGMEITQTIPESLAETRFEPPRCAMRYALIAFGWFNVALGTIGVVVPGMPTTVFLLIAMWAFSKSSEKFRVWLFNHKTLGPPIRDWHEHRVIPVRAKFMAVGMMSLSVVILSVFVANSFMLPTIVAACMAPVAIFIEDYEEAVRWGREATLLPGPGASLWTNRHSLVSALGHLGRLEEAARELVELQRLQPAISCSLIRDRHPLTDLDYQKILLDGLRKAGLPE